MPAQFRDSGAYLMLEARYWLFQRRNAGKKDLSDKAHETLRDGCFSEANRDQ
jgi:hypothetical protein